MSLSAFIRYLGGIASKDIFQLLEDLNNNILFWSQKSHIHSLVFLILGLVLAVAIGCVGYKLIKPTAAVFMGYIGFFVGIKGYLLWADKAEWLQEWVAWVMGIAVAIIFVCLTLARASYAVVTLAAIGGYIVTAFYVNSTLIAIGGAIVLAMITAHLVRTTYIIVTSAAAGILAVNFLGEMLPKVEALQLGAGKWIPLLIALGVAAVFAIIQGATNRYRGERI